MPQRSPRLTGMTWRTIVRSFLESSAMHLLSVDFSFLPTHPDLMINFSNKLSKKREISLMRLRTSKKHSLYKMIHMLEAILQQRQATQVMAKSSRAFSMALTRNRYVLTMTNLIHFTNASFAGLIPGRTQRKCQAFVPFSSA